MDKKLFRSILWIITYAVVLVLVIVKFDDLRGLFGTVLGLFQPLFIGFAIAFVLNRPCHAFCRLYSRGLDRTRAKGLARPLAVATSYLLLIVLIGAFFSIVLPKLVESIQLFLGSMNGYMQNVQGWLNALLSTLHLETLDLSNFSELIKTALSGVVNTLTTAVPQLVTITGNIMNAAGSTAGSGLAIGGTSIIIVVGVALETTKALEAQLMMRHYKGFLE